MPAGNYLNPPIEEAICEFVFAGPPQQGIDFSLPGKLQSHPKLSASYKGVVRAQNLQTVVAGDGPLSVQNALHRIQLPTEDAKRVISLGANTLAVSTLKPYDGWANFKPRIVDVLSAYFEISGHSTVVRIGLRYINRIVVPKRGSAEDFLVGIPPAYSGLSGALTSFVYRSEYMCEDRTKVIINQATLKPVTPGTSEFLLDIDTVAEGIELESVDNLSAHADRLHSLEGIAFEALITDKSRRLFDAL